VFSSKLGLLKGGLESRAGGEKDIGSEAMLTGNEGSAEKWKGQKRGGRGGAFVVGSSHRDPSAL